MFNCHGCRYDARCTDSEWNTPVPWTVKTQVKDGEWRAVAAIPLKAVGISPEQNNKVSALFYRAHPPRGPKQPTRHTSWGGGKVHSPDGFGELVFSLE